MTELFINSNIFTLFDFFIIGLFNLLRYNILRNRWFMKNIYIVLSQTGTMFSRALKFVTRAKYNHVSISLNESLDTMYSFGRLNAYNPFIGGFVEEGKNKGVFKRFQNTQAMVIELSISEHKYNAIKYFIDLFKITIINSFR